VELFTWHHVNTEREVQCWRAMFCLFVLSLAVTTGGCVADGIPYRVTRSWFDQDWDRQRPTVQVGGVDQDGWMHFIVTGGPVSGAAARMDVSDVWTEDDTLFVELRYSEPARATPSTMRIARLELEVLATGLPERLRDIQLVTEGTPISLVVTASDAVELVHGELADKPLGLSPEELDRLQPTRLLLLRQYRQDVLQWRWYVELASEGSAQADNTVRAVIDAVSGEILELVVNK